MLIFEHSWVVWLLPLPLLVWWLVPPIKRRRPAVRVPFLDRIVAASQSAAGPTTARSIGSSLLAAVTWVLLLTALARPQWLEPPIERVIPTRDLLLIVDLSGSMDQEDFTNEAGHTVDRLSAVKEVLGEFLVEREGDRVGLVVFGDSPFLQAPFTTDLALCRQLLDETVVGMAGPRTALGDALGLGMQLFANSDTPTKTIIALTDGNDTASTVPPVEAARVARDRGVTVHTIAIGDPTTVGEEALDLDALKRVASEAGGESFLALDREELKQIYDRLDQIETREVKTASHRPRRDVYYWPLGFALLLSFAIRGVALPPRRSPTRDSGAVPHLRVNRQTFEAEVMAT